MMCIIITCSSLECMEDVLYGGMRTVYALYVLKMITKTKHICRV